MTRPTFHSLAVAAALACTAGVAVAGQADPTPRKDIDPWDRAKVTSIEAQQRRGVDNVQRTDTRSGNVPGKQSCTTTIGPPPPPAGERQPRFGPQPRNQTVIVTGSVINVCK